MRGGANPARPLYLEIRALGLDLRPADHPHDRTDYAIAVVGLESLSQAHADRIVRRVGEYRHGLLHVLLNYGDRDCCAVRGEGTCR